MSGTLIAQSIAAAATLATQIAQMQTDILAAGNLDEATVDQLATVSADAGAALATATTLAVAHEAILEGAGAGAMLAGGQTPAALLAAFNLLIQSAQAAPIANNTVALLTRIQANVDAIGT